MLKEQEKIKSEDENASRFRDNLLRRSVFYVQKVDSSSRRRRSSVSRFKKGSRSENNPGHRRTRNQPKRGILSIEANELLKFKLEFLLKRHRAPRFWTKNLCCVRVYAIGGEMPWKERRLMGWQSVFKVALWRILQRFSRNVFSWIRFFVRRISLNFWYSLRRDQTCRIRTYGKVKEDVRLLRILDIAAAITRSHEEDSLWRNFGYLEPCSFFSPFYRNIHEIL